MADNMTPLDEQPVAEAPAAGEPKRGGRGFIASRAGKIAVGAALLVLVVALAAGAFFVFLGGSSDPSAPSAQGQAPTTPSEAVAQSAPATQSAEATVTPVEPAEVPLTDVFTFRDIFEPLLKAPATPTSSDGGTPGDGGPSGTTQTSSNTILLQDITSENGEPAAIVVWSGTTYTVTEGQRVGNSSWQVLSIGTDSVIMLYGDVQVALSVGQSITK